MNIEIKDLQELISKQKQLAGTAFFGAFSDGWLAAWDILNVYLKAKEPKCRECEVTLSEEECKEGTVCDACYARIQTEAFDERKREESAS